jgi:ABC-2 type transport system ATP-binding protein
MTAPEPLVVVDDVSRRYGDIEAVRGVSFTLQAGEILGFLGPNGAGKTTTMQMLTGNLAPSRGRIAIAGFDLLEAPREAKARIGYLPENPPVHRDLTVDEYLDFCAALNRLPRERRRAARDLAKEKCGLTDVGRRLIGNLSKGYQQRVGLAQAIIHLPALIVLDEPTAGLDPIQIREIRSLIRELGKEHGVILSTHILPEVQMVCGRALIIRRGEIALDDSIDGLAQRLQSSALQVAFRRAPDLALLQSLPGVRSIVNDGLRFHLLHEPAQDPTDALVRLAVEKDWGLYELRSLHASLEDLFVELTTTDHATEAA